MKRTIYIHPDVVKNKFLTHTVQMKLSMLPKTIEMLLNLYIPHGSDETSCKNTEKLLLATTFISHTVQMKHKEKSSIVLFNVYFISHTVQMKPKKT